MISKAGSKVASSKVASSAASPRAAGDIVPVLQARFAAHPERHVDLAWQAVAASLEAAPWALEALRQMEQSGGEPDVIGLDADGVLVFCDCSAESPVGRRSLCFDGEALAARKENKPAGSALGTAAAMGVELLTEDQYRFLQTLGEFDLKTSSWIQTPASIRALGGALVCDRRYDQVFTYHNGAQSYDASRGFRARLLVPSA